MTKPNEYNLGSTPEIYLQAYDRDGQGFTPTEMYISVEDPTTTITTVSGDGLSTTGSGYFYFFYRPLVKGWYQYETGAMDGAGHWEVKTNGFEVTDRVY